ncbi:hypothetical protein CGY94_17575 [Salmonella enterica subsp. enterica serovar Typhimurium]|nr:hypothetical protein [Salmonella enterica]EDI3138767.1 hypothetical protein [Salmonella enterica subsp. enterica serovar Typhimurium]EDI3325580.1 hypothetical protein [Salmonella enterica subsp. enterica serovar Typhimurium]EDJ4225096.1 hypothetical protein [Salmonella enterica subsp. enterica serovar Typhimurium]
MEYGTIRTFCGDLTSADSGTCCSSVCASTADNTVLLALAAFFALRLVFTADFALELVTDIIDTPS